MIEPRNYMIAGADAVVLAEGNIEARQWPSADDPAGVEEQGTFIVGSSRNLGGPVVSVDEPVLGIPVNNPWPVAVASCGCGSEA